MIEVVKTRVCAIHAFIVGEGDHWQKDLFITARSAIQSIRKGHAAPAGLGLALALDFLIIVSLELERNAGFVRAFRNGGDRGNIQALKRPIESKRQTSIELKWIGSPTLA